MFICNITNILSKCKESGKIVLVHMGLIFSPTLPARLPQSTMPDLPTTVLKESDQHWIILRPSHVGTKSERDLAPPSKTGRLPPQGRCNSGQFPLKTGHLESDQIPSKNQKPVKKPIKLVNSHPPLQSRQLLQIPYKTRGSPLHTGPGVLFICA